MEYILVSYFNKIQILLNAHENIEINQCQQTTKSDINYLLHVIDLNQAPKFFSDQAFKRFNFGEKNSFDGDIEALKDLVLLDIKKRVNFFFTFQFLHGRYLIID